MPEHCLRKFFFFFPELCKPESGAFQNLYFPIFHHCIIKKKKKKAAIELPIPQQSRCLPLTISTQYLEHQGSRVYNSVGLLDFPLFYLLTSLPQSLHLHPSPPPTKHLCWSISKDISSLLPPPELPDCILKCR